MNYQFIGAAFMPHPPIMLPEIGGDSCLRIKNTIEAAGKVGQLLASADTVIYMGPHGPAFKDAVTMFDVEQLTGNMARFGVPGLVMQMKIDKILLNRIATVSGQEKIRVALLNDQSFQKFTIQPAIDHAGLVPLYFLSKAGFSGKVVYMNMGYLPYREMYDLGQMIGRLFNDSGNNADICKVAIIVSGDLSHRLKPGAPAGYDPQGAVFDGQVVEALRHNDVELLNSLEPELIEAAGECGLRPAFFLMGVLSQVQVERKVLTYEGPFGVGYAVAGWVSAINKNRP